MRYIAIVDQSGNVALTHGELPCPACGYQRRGLALDIACPECGARGFEGELIVSGLPGVERESRRSGSIFSLIGLLIPVMVFLPDLLGRQLSKPWRKAGSAIGLTVAAIALAIYAIGYLRRRRERAANLSPERFTLELRPDVLVVREREVDLEVPYGSILMFDTQVDLPKRRILVWLVIRGRKLQANSSSPTMVMVGDLDNQRAIASEMKARIVMKRL